MSKIEIQLLGVAPLILVYDMKVSLDFYCRIIGFTLVTGIETILKAGAIIRNGVIPWLENTDEIPPEKKRPIEFLLKKYSGT